MPKWKTILALSSIVLTLLMSTTSAQAPGIKASGDMEVPMAGEGKSITVTVPTNITGWSLTPGQDNTEEGTLKVTAGAGWSVSVSDENGTTLGKMTEYDTTSGEYIKKDPDKLQAYMGVTAAGTYGSGSCVTLPTGGAIASGDSTSEEVKIPVTFNQTVYWDDPVSGTNRGYKIVITFAWSLTS